MSPRTSRGKRKPERYPFSRYVAGTQKLIAVPAAILSNENTNTPNGVNKNAIRMHGQHSMVALVHTLFQRVIIDGMNFKVKISNDPVKQTSILINSKKQQTRKSHCHFNIF
mmetsp:Transcript_5273/g.9451  ORF Transcript_5273/g.9451 Transcript_5273/m.9451 type:complete len:111 (-) Transcript_5273:1101-1433(-)